MTDSTDTTPRAPRYPGETPDGAFRAEVFVRGERNWAHNALRFDTAEHANQYARDLSGRWLLVDKWRAVPVTHPEREAYVPGSEDGGWS